MISLVKGKHRVFIARLSSRFRGQEELKGRRQKRDFNRAYSCGLPSLAQSPPVCTSLCKERCFVAQGELCYGRQAVVGSTAHLEIWSGLYFYQNTAYFCGILHLAQVTGQASCCGDIRNSVIGEEAVAQSPLKNSSLSFPEQCLQWHQEHCHQMLEGMEAGLGFLSPCSRW